MNRYRLKFKILRVRIESWGRKWGFENAQSQEEEYQLYSTDDTRSLILALLGNLEVRQIKDKKVISRYGLFAERKKRLPQPLQALAVGNIRAEDTTDTIQQAFSDEAYLQADEHDQSPLTLKARWARDVDKVKLLRSDIEDIIDDLERLEGIREQKIQRQSKKHGDYRSTNAASTILHRSLKMSTQLSSCFRLNLKLEKDRQSLVPFAKTRLTYLRNDTTKFSLILSSPPPYPSILPVEFISVVIETYRSPRSSLENSNLTELEARLTEDLDELLDALKKPRPGRPEPFLVGGFLSVGGEQNHVVYRVPFQNQPTLSWITLSMLLDQQGMTLAAFVWSFNE